MALHTCIWNVHEVEVVTDSTGPFLSNNFSPGFPLFFPPRKTGEAGKTGNISKVLEILTEEKYLERLQRTAFAGVAVLQGLSLYYERMLLIVVIVAVLRTRFRLSLAGLSFHVTVLI